MTNIFSDLHHGDLYYSIHLLFEERLGADLYRPIGMEWFEKGFWKIAEPYGNAPDTIRQYLEMPPTSKTHQHDVQKYGETQIIDGIYHVPCKVSDEYYVQKAITFKKFLEMDFDFILATYPGHYVPYARLVREYKPSATYIEQIGNVLVRPKGARYVLLATNEPMPEGIEYVKYHPEHHRDYAYTPPTSHDVVKSFINCLPQNKTNAFWWNEYERSLPELKWKMHGILGRDGAISNDRMPEAIKDSSFVWHVKDTGCCGFVPRQAMACGRPCIVKKGFAVSYRTLAMDLFLDSVNCIDLDLGTKEENLEKILYFSKPEKHLELCKRTVESFKKMVDFDREFSQIRSLLERARRKL